MAIVDLDANVSVLPKSSEKFEVDMNVVVINGEV
jgi:hypothetical protein